MQRKRGEMQGNELGGGGTKRDEAVKGIELLVRLHIA